MNGNGVPNGFISITSDGKLNVNFGDSDEELLEASFLEELLCGFEVSSFFEVVVSTFLLAAVSFSAEDFAEVEFPEAVSNGSLETESRASQAESIDTNIQSATSNAQILLISFKNITSANIITNSMKHCYAI